MKGQEKYEFLPPVLPNWSVPLHEGLPVVDVEGNLPYFKRCLSYTTDVFYVDKEQTQLGLRDNVIFVYGGDAFDKGPWDIRFATQLLDLKERYPDRVVLIIGTC